MAEPTKTEWWHVADALTRQDELLAQILIAIQALGGAIPPPPSNGEIGHSPNRAVVGTTLKEIMDYNDKRYWAVITNDSSTKCYIGLTEGVSVSNGLQLNQNDVFTIDLTNPYTGPIYAITESGEAVLKIMQVSRRSG